MSPNLMFEKVTDEFGTVPSTVFGSPEVVEQEKRLREASEKLARK